MTAGTSDVPASDGGARAREPDAVSPVPDAPSQHDVDARTVRRGLRAGLLVTAVVGTASLLGTIALGGDGVTAGIWITSAVVLGALVTSGWLVLALALDLIAGVVPGRWRVVWTAAAFAVAFLSPILPAAMLQVAGAR